MVLLWETRPYYCSCDPSYDERQFPLLVIVQRIEQRQIEVLWEKRIQLFYNYTIHQYFWFAIEFDSKCFIQHRDERPYFN